MENVPRNVILDLLPGYIAGEASAETRALVEAFAQKDAEIARLIRAGQLAPEAISPELTTPQDLEMKTMKRIRASIRRQMLYVATATAAILMVPLIAMQFTDEVNWDLADFIVMAILLLGSGLAYVLIAKLSDSTAYRVAVGIAALAGFLLIWVNLAVGIIGSEDNPANLLYLAVLAAGIIGAGWARFQPRGMARALFVTAVVQLLVPVIAVIIWWPSFEGGAGMVGIFILNAFFAALFAIAGLLFRNSAKAQ